MDEVVDDMVYMNVPFDPTFGRLLNTFIITALHSFPPPSLQEKIYTTMSM